MLTYAPDAGELDPNLLMAAAILPNQDGSWRVPPAVSAATTVTPGAGSGNSVVASLLARLPDKTLRLLFASATKLYDCDGAGTVTDRSAGGGSYVSDSQWHFCQYGSQSIACSKNNATQLANEGGSFAALAGAPQARISATSAGALLLANVVLNGVDQPNGLAISDIDNITQWTPDLVTLSNEAYQTQLTEMPGEITSMIPFRDMVVIFKQRGMWLAQYVGRPLVWDVRLFSPDVGCGGKDGCVVAGDTLYFSGDRGVFSFDGAQIRTLTNPKNAASIAQFFSLATAGFSFANPIALAHDEVLKQIWIYLGLTGQFTDAYVYNYVSGQWSGRIRLQSAPAAGFMTAVLRGALGDFSDFAPLASPTTYNHRHWWFVSAGGANYPRDGFGLPQAGIVTTRYFGAPNRAQLMNRIYLNIDDPTGITVSVQATRAPRIGATAQSLATGSATADGFIDLLVSGHFFQVTYTIAITATFTKWQDHAFDLSPAGAN